MLQFEKSCLSIVFKRFTLVMQVYFDVLSYKSAWKQGMALKFTQERYFFIES